MKLFIYTIIIIVAAAIIAGFFMVGSPGQERLRRFDETKIRDLQTIQSEIIYFWQNKQRLPQNLDELHDSIRGFAPPTDPQSNEPYAYMVIDQLNFELCASFNLPSDGLVPSDQLFSRNPPPASDIKPNPVSYDQTQNWVHQEGLTCFRRTIDPDIYKPIEK
ncbi:MAG: hypothetical protein Q8R08_01105 [bacterium]|nr:hypothetical protein [bacterium]